MSTANLPRHVAIIMDGNGRWATARGLPRTEGHRQGLQAAKRIVLAARSAGIAFLSLYTFSTENWKRTQEEVGFLMSLLTSHLSAELDFYRQHSIKVIHSGDREGLPPSVLREIDSVCAETASHDGMVVNLAINYGGRNELVRAIRNIARASSQGLLLPEAIDEAVISSFLDHPEVPDPDLIIRTGGDYRISNFLLWESAYSELYFSSQLWPDFSAEDLEEALRNYGGRERRFGGVR
ncbi:MAG: polyprenyl diphosphate synthase [Spirochaetales bacterium]|nr:polyprenyl diphosphate synthase [Spirochaetales bacterium]